MVVQDLQGFYGHDDLPSLSLLLKFTFSYFSYHFFELLQALLIQKNSQISKQKHSNSKIKKSKFSI
jgi:hypothetical protein